VTKKDRGDDGVLTSLAAKRRLNWEIRKIEEAYRALVDLEKRVRTPSVEEYQEIASGKITLTPDAYMVVVLKTLTPDLESLLSFCADGARGLTTWLPEEVRERLGPMVRWHAKEQLEALMERIAEEQGGPGWKEDRDLLMWAALQGDAISPFHLSEEEKKELRRLSTGSEGWPCLDEDRSYLFHLNLRHWELRYAKWRSAQPDQKRTATTPPAP